MLEDSVHDVDAPIALEDETKMDVLENAADVPPVAVLPLPATVEEDWMISAELLDEDSVEWDPLLSKPDDGKVMEVAALLVADDEDGRVAELDCLDDEASPLDADRLEERECAEEAPVRDVDDEITPEVDS